MKNILTEALVNSVTNASFICSYTNSAKLRFQFLGQYVFEIYILQRVSMIIFKRYFHEWIYFLICIVVTFGLAYVFKKLETKIDMLI